MLTIWWSSQIQKWLHPKWQKCHSEHQTLFIDIRKGLGTRLLPNVLCCSSKLCPQSPSEALLHICLQSNWKNIYLLYICLAPPYHKSLDLCPQFQQLCSHLEYSVCQIAFTDKPDAKTLILVSIQVYAACGFCSGNSKQPMMGTWLHALS